MIRLPQDMKYQEVLNNVLDKHYRKEFKLQVRQERIQQFQDLKCVAGHRSLRLRVRMPRKHQRVRSGRPVGRLGRASCRRCLHPTGRRSGI